MFTSDEIVLTNANMRGMFNDSDPNLLGTFKVVVRPLG